MTFRSNESIVRKGYTLSLFKKFKAKLYGNPCGCYKRDDGAYITYGLERGSADDIGILPIIITKEMIGKQIGVFLSVEGKAEGWKPIAKEPENKSGTHWKKWKKEKEQFDWARMVRNFGGCSFFADSVETAENEIKKFIKGLENAQS